MCWLSLGHDVIARRSNMWEQNPQPHPGHPKTLNLTQSHKCEKSWRKGPEQETEQWDMWNHSAKGCLSMCWCEFQGSVSHECGLSSIPVWKQESEAWFPTGTLRSPMKGGNKEGWLLMIIILESVKGSQGRRPKRTHPEPARSMAKSPKCLVVRDKPSG